MRITVWNDHICPWAYAARPLTSWLVDEAQTHGHEVAHRSYELHPELPREGRAVRPGGTLDRVFDHIAEVCEEQDQPFTKPTHTPNSHRLLARIEIVRARQPAAWADVDRAIAHAYWADGRDIGDDTVVLDTLEGAGVDVAKLLDDEAAGLGERLLEENMTMARDVGVAATPAWQVGDLVITGLQPSAQFQRWFTRIFERSRSRTGL